MPEMKSPREILDELGIFSIGTLPVRTDAEIEGESPFPECSLCEHAIFPEDRVAEGIHFDCADVTQRLRARSYSEAVNGRHAGWRWLS